MRARLVVDVVVEAGGLKGEDYWGMRTRLVVDVVVEAGGLAMPTEHWPLP